MSDIHGHDAERPEPDPAAEHGDSPDEVDTVDAEDTTPFHNPAEAEADSELGGHLPLH
ncbi:hypothetical protein EDF46_2016 [Frondihabitans sp. PhB188]|uniref:hypothetical protein n=1 Tax=Frondihabitans sp. PhB188 TaxID=2485200 RepID=UPI000FB19CB1|nr:hypothetical protein [Frondihabitans sp. PhB188]ROQ38381.1 hypothetical protein EDF46_2016 [Frondihabitans sp. PhB188]